MPDGTRIGQWATRPGGVWHLIESDVADDYVMRCGRRMTEHHPQLGDLAFVTDTQDWPRCRQCTRVVE